MSWVLPSTYMRRRRHKRAPGRENSKHSKNNLKIYVIIFDNFFRCGGWTVNMVLFYMSVNKSSYIYLIILLFD